MRQVGWPRRPGQCGEDRRGDARRRRHCSRAQTARAHRRPVARRTPHPRSAGPQRVRLGRPSRLAARPPGQGRSSPRSRHGRMGLGTAPDVERTPSWAARRPVLLPHQRPDDHPMHHPFHIHGAGRRCSAATASRTPTLSGPTPCSCGTARSSTSSSRSPTRAGVPVMGDAALLDWLRAAGTRLPVDDLGVHRSRPLRRRRPARGQDDDRYWGFRDNLRAMGIESSPTASSGKATTSAAPACRRASTWRSR